MRKMFILFLASLLLVGCASETADNLNSADQGQKGKQMGPQDLDSQFAQLRGELQAASASGGIDPSTYNRIVDQIQNLENQGYDSEKTAELFDLLSQLSVGGSASGKKSVTKISSDDVRTSLDSPSMTERSQLPDCTAALLTVSPVDVDEIVSIEPLGSTTPPEHTLPSSSSDVYIAVDTRETEKTVPLYAPADLWITSISQSKGKTSDPEDTFITYAFCKDVFGLVDHVKSLSSAMQALIDSNDCQGGEPAGYDFSICTIQVFEPVKAGTILGEVGRRQGNFNFGTWDLRRNNSFIDPQRYGSRALHSSCPFDYYVSPLKEQLESKLEGGGCGTVEYDLAGTMQGEWFYGDATNRMGPQDWPNQLFLGHNNRFPEAATISVGGVISEPIKWLFVPQSSGLINVDFNLISDDRIYCYQSDGQYSNFEKGPKGKILLQLKNGLLVAEHQSGTCTGSDSFLTPQTYER